MSLKLRRGLSTDLTTVTPAEGELLYTTDTKRIYVGDGSTAGGTPATYSYIPQPLLVSGTNIKTIGGVSLLGSGNIDIASLPPNWVSRTFIPGAGSGVFTYPSSTDTYIALYTMYFGSLDPSWSAVSPSTIWYTGTRSITPSYSGGGGGEIYALSFNFYPTNRYIGSSSSVSRMGSDIYFSNEPYFYGSVGTAFVVFSVGPSSWSEWAAATPATGVSMYKVEEGYYSIILKIPPDKWGSTVVTGVTGYSSLYAQTLYLY